jgi:hypothetical protein
MKPTPIVSVILLVAIVLAVLGWRSRPSFEAAPAQPHYSEAEPSDIDYRDLPFTSRSVSGGSPSTGDPASLAAYAAEFSGPWDQGLRARLRALGPVGLFEFLLDPTIAARDDGWLWLRDIHTVCWFYGSSERAVADVDRWCAPLRDRYALDVASQLLYDRQPDRSPDMLPDLPPADAVVGLDLTRQAEYFDALHAHLRSDDPDMVMASIQRLWSHEDPMVSAAWPDLRMLPEDRNWAVGYALMMRAGCAVAGDCSATARQTMMSCAIASLGWHCPPGAPMDEVLRQNLTPHELALLNQTLLHWRRGRGG